MKIARREHEYEGNQTVAYYVYCPACERGHRFAIVNEADPANVWQFDGNMDHPTFTPSLLISSSYWRNERWEPEICHSYLRAGVWEFLNDCTHDLAGQKVSMVDFPKNYRV